MQDSLEVAPALQLLGGTELARKGRTPSYERMEQAVEDGSPSLVVEYRKHGRATYSRDHHSVYPSEKRNGKGHPVHYNVARGAWMSPSIDELDESGNRKALPTKVAQFLRGKCTAQLATLKGGKGHSLPVDLIQECRD